jgi:hypothetical protein
MSDLRTSFSRIIVAAWNHLMRLNATDYGIFLLKLARRGEHIQSQVLRIPDGWGIFTQNSTVKQAQNEGVMVFLLTFTLVGVFVAAELPLFIYFYMRLEHKLLLLLAKFCAVWRIFIVLFYWTASIVAQRVNKRKKKNN